MRKHRCRHRAQIALLEAAVRNYDLQRSAAIDKAAKEFEENKLLKEQERKTRADHETQLRNISAEMHAWANVARQVSAELLSARVDNEVKRLATPSARIEEAGMALTPAGDWHVYKNARS